MNLTRRTLLNSLALTTAATLAHPLEALADPSSAEDSPIHDRDRPSVHLQPARGWMNDPCGPIFYRGLYHMFHQYNPHAAVWGDMNWAHATSPDMVHWTRLPVALSPTPGSSDAQGCFTGSAILLHGRPTFLYTGVQTVPLADATLADGNNNFRESQNLAIATDDSLRTWRKLPQPVIPTPPPGMHVTGFRDPCPFQHGGSWYTLIGSGIPAVGGNVLLYRATNPDLTQWEYLHPLLQGKWRGTPGTNPVDTGEMWECPDFFPLGGPSGDGGQANGGGKHVLIYSTQGKTLWHTGTFDPATLLFQPEKSGELDYGHGTFYAPKTQLDAHGNRILWGWLPETRPQAEFSRAGWSGMMSLPRRLYLINAELHMEPAVETQRLRSNPNPNPNPSSSSNQLPNTAQEFSCVLQASSSRNASHQTSVASSPNLTASAPYLLSDAVGPLLAIYADPNLDATTLRITGGAPAVANLDIGSPDLGNHDVIIPLSEPLPAQAGLHIFLDNSVLEIFIDSRFCITRRFYATGTHARDPHQSIATLILPGAIQITRPQSFSLKSIWPT